MLAQLSLFAGDTHASHSVTPGSEKARMMTVTSGQKCIGSWLPSGPVGSLLKMLLGTSTWASTACFLTWKARATPAGRLLFQLAPSMPRTEETEFGLWPTIRASDGERGGRGDLIQAARGNENKHFKLWPTPLSQEAKHAAATEWELATDHVATKGSLRVHVAKSMFPTPTSQDAANNGGPSQHERNSLPLNAVAGGSLNPAWVEWLMGYPEGWTDLED
jgi:hypothetical protein